MPELSPRFRVAAVLLSGTLAVAAWVGVAAFATAPPPPMGQTLRSETAIALPELRVGDPDPSTAAGSSQRTLREVLTAIQREHGISIVLDRDVPDTGHSGIDPTGLAPEEALRQALKGHDLFFHYGPKRDTGALELKRVWVFTHDRGENLQVMAKPAQPASGLEISDPQQRIAELHKLSGQTDTDPQEALMWALADPVENVRQQALIAAQANGLPIAVEALETFLTSDPSEIVRKCALEVLTLNPEIDPSRMQGLLDHATHDSSMAVRELAASLLNPSSPPPDEPAEPVSGSVSAEVPVETPFDASAGNDSGNASSAALMR
jgi:hypothetical protein